MKAKRVKACEPTRCPQTVKGPASGDEEPCLARSRPAGPGGFSASSVEPPRSFPLLGFFRMWCTFFLMHLGRQMAFDIGQLPRSTACSLESGPGGYLGSVVWWHRPASRPRRVRGLPLNGSSLAWPCWGLAATALGTPETQDSRHLRRVRNSVSDL